MATLISVTEYTQEGFAIVEDTEGKYVTTRNSPDIIPLSYVGALLGVKTPCALLQSRDRMLT